MEARKAKELRVRLRRVKCNNTSSCSSPSAGKVRAELPSTSKIQAPPGSCSPSDSDGDDYGTVHFKLAAAQEPGGAASDGGGTSPLTGGHLFDWQSMKTALISEAKSASRARANASAAAAAKSAAGDVSDAGRHESESTDSQSGAYVKPRRGSDSSTTSSSDEDDDVPDMLLVSPEPNADTADADPERSMLLSKLPFSDPGVSVVDDKNPAVALSKILSLPPFDPHAPHLQVQLIIKSVVSLTQLSMREDNLIEVEIKKSILAEFASGKKDRALSPFMDFPNILVKHSLDEFFTFCSCKNCVKYREIVIHIMVEQFKTAHMVVMLLDVLIKAYGPMLKNVTAYNKFEKLLDANKEIYWIACGFVYNKKAEHMDFIYDESLSDNMIFVLFSSILMVNNPLLLLQILAFHVECIVKAYAEGFLEIVEPDNNKIPAEEMLTYILDGYDDLCRISEQISCYLFAFENDFLRKFSLTWTLLCQRLYQQHVYSNLTDTMLACIITLKEEELTTRHAALIKKYIQFDDKMNYVEKRWTDVWIELNKFNLSEAERKRRKCLLDVHRIFDTVVQDAIAFSLQEFDDDNDFYDFQCLENRRLAWQNIMAYTKMKWPDGFFEPPNTLVVDDKCKKCSIMLEYHAESCKCITCSIAGGPLPPRRNPDHTCYQCLEQSLVEKGLNLYESKILNVCASDDFLSFVKSNGKRKSTTLEELGEEVCASMPAEAKNENASEGGQYHLAWAVFQHFNNRKRYRHAAIEEKYFCTNCRNPACLLARKILNNEIAHALSLHLVRYYQPLLMSREELRAILPNIMLYNRKMIAFNIGFDLTDVHDLVVKIYWTFIISLYATYFMEFEEKCPLNLSLLEIANNDIRLNTDTLAGNKDDTKFVQFLDKIKSLSPFKSKVESDFAFTVDVHTEEIQSKLDKLLNIHENQLNPPFNEKIPPPASNIEATPTADEHPKRNCKEKSKKCCFDHSDLGEHCKENHSSKKRIKKECNHARMNETRDRLRKKLSQLVNARKNMKTAVEQQNVAATTTATLNANTKQPPSLKSVASAAAAASSKSNVRPEEDDDSLVCLSTLCKRISHLHTSKTQGCNTAAPNPIGKKAPPASTPVKKATTNAHSAAREATASVNNNNNNSSSSNKGKQPSNCSGHPHTASASSSDKGAKGIDVLSVYLNNYSREFLDNYSRDQSKVRKWINETLSYIEGSGGGGSGKKQPQPTNPKKAAKKAKQKQRKEEEKRIAELHDLRAQFHDIYFKEFTDKHKLKTLKASKKRDKKQISDLESNVKKLQRAKAKVETVILELIATVKQTNDEFKFPYLPTKEQQLEKLKEMETTSSNFAASGTTNSPVTASQQQPLQAGAGAMSMASTALSTNNLNTAPLPPGNYGLPYGHPNLPSFPYHIDFQAQSSLGGAAAAYGMMRSPLPTPMCYAPPPQQTLSPDVVAAMAANAACNSNSDPSKRIVTIRRVNLPNVPEPQVTVTAKGSSPDKDKLLYTFVNGQLVPTGGATPPMTQLPMPPQMPLSLPVQASHLANVPEHLISIPPPPLSKTQLKKERRRQAKLAAEEAIAAAKAEQLRQEHERQLQLQCEKQKAANKNNKGKLNEKCKKEQPAAQKKTPLEQADARIAEAKQKKKNVVTPSASNTSVSTAEAAEAAKPAKQSKAIQRRSTSGTTWCSAGTSSSATPISSQVNTRDNSVCSQKPSATGLAATKRVKQCDLGREKQMAQAQKLAIQKQPQQKKIKQPQPQQHLQTKPSTKKAEAAVNTEVEVKVSPQLPSPQATVQAEQERSKKERRNRSKFVDNGQFDNNPFKSLHMQDSDTEWDSASSFDDVSDEEPTEVPIQKVVAEPVAKPKPAPVLITKPPEPPPPMKEQRPSTKVLNKKTQQETNSSKFSNNAESCRKQQTQQQQRPVSKTQQPREQKRESQIKPKLKSEALPAQSRQVGSKASQLDQQQSHRTRQSKQQQQHHSQPQLEELPHKSQQQAQHSRSRGGGGDGRHQSSVSGNGKRGNSSAAGNRFERSQNTSVGGNVGAQPPHGAGGNGRSSNRHNAESAMVSAEGKPLSKRAQKQALRNKKFQKQQQHNHAHNNYDDCCSGIPNNMGYFNPNDVAIPPASKPHSQTNQQPVQQQQFNNLAQQMQGLQLGSAHYQQPHTMPSYASVSNNYHKPSTSAANISIMDQLNRGVQVENLSLPPGITLTKVDPVKSEQLRQKSESIRKLSKPLQSQSAGSQSFHHPGATIIAPPVAPMSSYYGAPYAGVAAAAALDQSGIIMVEANPPASSVRDHPKTPGAAAVAAAAAASASGKTSKSKKRRNKSKQESNARAAAAAAAHANGSNAGGAIGAAAVSGTAANQTKMITLRNPMFHGGAASAAATILQQQPSLLPGRPLGGLPLPTPLPVDQPAAIIKNENGMFTIRNPALHQAVTNGLALGGYRQFGNVSYYTPQEAAAEAARATQQSAASAAVANDVSKSSAESNNPSTAFSYFSNNPTSTGTPSAAPANSGTANPTHNTISISCTSIDGSGGSVGNGGGGLSGDAAVIARPAPTQKCISAIGSEIKSAQQQKQKSKEHDQWASFVHELSGVGLPQRNATENLACGAAAAAYLGSTNAVAATSSGGANGTGVCLSAASLQEKYQQSTYYNGFDVFPATSNSSQISSTGGRSSNTGSLFDSSDCHMHHHNCGDDSPPPTITGFNSYLDGIPNTGVIRYDDASFLKNLIPGQNLNNEVSIHNVNDSNFTRSTTSPVAHRVEITPVYGSRPTSTNTYEHCTAVGVSSAQQPPTVAEQQTKFMPNTVANYRDNLADFGNDASNIFATNNLVNLNELDAGVVSGTGAEPDVESFKCFGYDFEASAVDKQQQKAMLDLKDLLIKKSPHSQRTSPYLDEAAMESFVQNINSLQISAPPEEQCARQLNGNGNSNSSGGGSNGSSGGAASTSTATTNGWW